MKMASESRPRETAWTGRALLPEPGQTFYREEKPFLVGTRGGIQWRANPETFGFLTCVKKKACRNS